MLIFQATSVLARSVHLLQSLTLKPLLGQFSYNPMQRVHVDYCGAFVNSYYALIIIDSYSKYPQVYFSKSTDVKFTKSALQRFFADEGVPQVLVSDNGPQFRAEDFRQWLHRIGVCQLFCPARHPQSNGQAENFVRTLKGAIRAAAPVNSNELFNITDNFLLQYRSACHATTKKPPSLLFKGRLLRSSAAMDTTRVIFKKGVDQQPQSGIVIGRRGHNCLEIIDNSDGSIHMRHRDQVYIPPSTNAPVQQPASGVTQEQDKSTLEEALPTSFHNTTNTTTSSSPVIRSSTRTKRLPKKFDDYILTGRRCDR